MLSGDLARNGHIQLLVVNRLPKTPGNGGDTALVSRAAILEKEAGEWREIFLADDHLKNDDGFLRGAPRGSVSAWHLQWHRGKGGLTMFFRPFREGPGPDSATVEVRWNPRKGRYQTFDRQSKNFLAEVPTIGGTPSFLIKR